jgi:hypothetical protein
MMLPSNLSMCSVSERYLYECRSRREKHSQSKEVDQKNTSCGGVSQRRTPHQTFNLESIYLEPTPCQTANLENQPLHIRNINAAEYTPSLEAKTVRYIPGDDAA